MTVIVKVYKAYMKIFFPFYSRSFCIILTLLSWNHRMYLLNIMIYSLYWFKNDEINNPIQSFTCTNFSLIKYLYFKWNTYQLILGSCVPHHFLVDSGFMQKFSFTKVSKKTNPIPYIRTLHRSWPTFMCIYIQYSFTFESPICILEHVHCVRN